MGRLSAPSIFHWSEAHRTKLNVSQHLKRPMFMLLCCVPAPTPICCKIPEADSAGGEKRLLQKKYIYIYHKPRHHLLVMHADPMCLFVFSDNRSRSITFPFTLLFHSVSLFYENLLFLFLSSVAWRSQHGARWRSPSSAATMANKYRARVRPIYAYILNPYLGRSCVTSC